MPCAHAPHVPESQRPTLPTVPHRRTIHTSRALNPQRLDPLVMANRSSPHKGTALSYIDTLSALRPAPSSTVRDPRRPAGLGSCPTPHRHLGPPKGSKHLPNLRPRIQLQPHRRTHTYTRGRTL